MPKLASNVWKTGGIEPKPRLAARGVMGAWTGASSPVCRKASNLRPFAETGLHPLEHFPNRPLATPATRVKAVKWLERNRQRG